MSWLSKTIRAWRLGVKGTKMAENAQNAQNMPGTTVAQVKLTMNDGPADFGTAAAYSRATTIKKGAAGGFVGGIVAYAVLSAVQGLRNAGNPLIVWDAGQDDAVIAGLVAFALGAWAMLKNLFKQKQATGAAATTVKGLMIALALGLTGCTTTFGPGGLTITGSADSAAQMAPTVISVTRSIAEMVAKIAAERDVQKQTTLAVKLKAEQERLSTILEFVGRATGVPK